ncbi:DNA mismatch repair protein MSH3 isoform X2 [Aristolochia californica]|uniref:DNA mismatch repair protein MSH3 isoform X2 n=1 Tax=Aristolochia californica TaxID=171875 RepID=UPI0035D98518
MGKQKQQVISRFFSPKPKSDPNAISGPRVSPPPPASSPAKVTATVSFTPSKRRVLTLNPESPISKTAKTVSSPSPLPSSNPFLHQKFVQKLLEPSKTPSQADTAAVVSKNPKYTPLEQQVVELKSKYPDVLLMIEVGYKYRFFGEDAEIAARVLGIFAHVDHSFLTASIPTFRLDFHVRRLVSAGYKVGVVKQTETAAIKAHGANKLGPFSRGLSALYTKATLEAAAEFSAVDDAGACGGGNYLVCVVDRGVLAGAVADNFLDRNFDVKVGIIGVEISTGDVMFGEFNDNIMRSGLESILLSLLPAEILLGGPLSIQTEKLLLAYAGPASNVRVEHASRDCFKDGGALAEVMTLYESNVEEDTAFSENSKEHAGCLKEEKRVLGIEGIMSMPELAVQALALTIRYLKQFNLERILCLGASFQPLSSNIEMSLSANALQQLEILRNNTDGSENGSLLQAMNHTRTAFGSRLLRHWVAHPLRDRNLISARLDAVSEIAKSMGRDNDSQVVVEVDDEASCQVTRHSEIDSILSSVLTTLGRSPDVQRGITRTFHRTASPAEFISVIHAILSAGKQLQRLPLDKDEDKIGNFQGKIIESSLLRRLILTASSSSLITHAVRLLSLLSIEAANKGDLQNLFIVSDGQFPEVAKARTAVQTAEEKLDFLINLLRKQLGMRNLEFISISGVTHLIELPSDKRVPSSWLKVNSTKKMVRYHPPEVLNALDVLSLAKEELAVACRSSWDQFILGFGQYYPEFQAAVQALASLDCLCSLAILSRNQNYVRPVFLRDDEPGQIKISSGCHPVLASILQDNFVPNDTNLHANGEYCQIITGPNMGGKSCYIRQVALIAIMAQVGSFVPATSATLHVLDAVYTRMGSSDSIQQGRSTFFEELSEASHILHNATSRSLVIIDELGRGTSTHDGVAIAYATLHSLLKQKSMVLFVTHYPNIIDIKEEFPSSVGSYHVSFLASQQNLGIESKPDSETKSLDGGGATVTFLYKVVPGISNKSFGLNVARLAQIPTLCIARAAVMAAKLEAEVSHRVEARLAQKQYTGAAFSAEHFQGQQDSSQPEAASREQFAGLFVYFVNGAKRLLPNLLEHLDAAFVDSDPANSLCSLKNAKELAVRILNSERWAAPLK